VGTRQEGAADRGDRVVLGQPLPLLTGPLIRGQLADAVSDGIQSGIQNL
jgi:hypothetical protein